MGSSRALLMLVLVSLAAVTAAGAQAPGGDDGFSLYLPARRPAAAAPSAPPNLPADAERVAPRTFDVLVRRPSGANSGTDVRHTVSLTADRAHVRVQDNREWLFERNLVDHRRVSATLVDHARRRIVLHEESELRNLLGIAGWADVLAFEGRARASRVPVENVRPSVDGALLQPAIRRFPDYAVVSLADSLEAH